MLTVKHIRFDGTETIDHAERVIFYAVNPLEAGQAPRPATPHLLGSVTAIGAISGSVDWHSGLIYVMNDSGATVAKYDLGPGIPNAADHLGIAA